MEEIRNEQAAEQVTEQTAEQVAEQTAEQVTEQTAEQVAEQAAPAAESMDNFAAELDSSMRQIAVGDIVEGTVAGITDSEITVDLAYYAEGIIRPADYSGDPSFNFKEDVHVGDAVKAVVKRMDDGHGNILLSKREADEAAAWDKFSAMLESRETAEIKVAEAVKAGVVGYLDGVRVFVPASKLSLEYVEDLNTWVGKTIPIRLITVEREGKKLVASSRDVLREQRDAQKAEMISNLQVGLVTEGTVQSLQTYGAFVALGNGIDGLVHISQITNTKRLKHPKEMLSVGDKVKVKVIGIKEGKVSLSMKALEEGGESRPAEKVYEERVELPKSEDLTTSLGDLLKGIKLD